MNHEKQNNLNFYRENMVKEPIFLTGLSRSGKTMLMPILASFRKVENIGLDYLMEQIPMVHSLGEMTDSAAVFMLRSAINFMAYDQAIGRNVNFRYSDISSVWRTENPAEYFQRLFTQDGDHVMQRIIEKQPLYLLMVHNALWHAQLYFKAFPNLKMIHIERHPVDIIHSWFRRGYYKDFADNPRNSLITLQHKDENFLFYTHGWEEDYAQMNICDRTIAMVHHVYENHQNTLKKFSEQQQARLKIVFFEQIVTQTDKAIVELSQFLNTVKSNHTDKECQRERCPRILALKERHNKFNELKSQASEYGVQLLLQMDKEYTHRLNSEDQKGEFHELKKK